MIEEIQKILEDVKNSLNSIETLESLLALESETLGKDGKLKSFLKQMKDLSNDDKKEIGAKINSIKSSLDELFSEKKVFLEEKSTREKEQKESIDVTLKMPFETGHFHPITKVSRVLEDIFISLGFKIEDGPQVENEDYNFSKLNIPDDHPARDVWDTFWISDEINNTKNFGERLLLRTHTSPVQVRTMLQGKFPIKVVVPGRVFRYEQEDARHTCNFYQFEGLVVGEDVTFGDLKGTLETVMKALFGEETQIRLRPSIFPFTEPSCEVDVSCQICNGRGEKEGKRCSMCSGSGWVELLGAGVVNPKVLEYCGIDSKKYSGFAFGMGIDRLAAQKYSVSSSRLFYQNRLKLNYQF